MDHILYGTKKKIYITIGFLALVGILIFLLIRNGEEFQQEKIPIEQPEILSYAGLTNNNTVGYEYIDANTIHFWNEVDDYYLNLSSGIQWSNHYEEYWTHNIFCAGYKTTQWNYLCSDNLPIQLNVYSDNSTYVQINGTRVIQIAGRNIGMGIDYYLGTQDDELSITTGLKHLSGNPITNDLGFAWRVNNIKIDNDVETDEIFVNNSVYDLSDDLDLLFKNMTIIETRFEENATLNQSCFDGCIIINDSRGYCLNLCTIFNSYNETTTKYIPFYKLIDNSFVQLRWNENRTYFLQVKNTSQYNSPVTLAIVTTGLNSGQTKKTTFFWKDPTPTVTLSAPADESTGLPSTIDFLANMTTTTNTLLWNFTLWHDITGTWHLNKTIYPELPAGLTYDILNKINTSGMVAYLRCNKDFNVNENYSYCYDWSGQGSHGYILNAKYSKIMNTPFDRSTAQLVRTTDTLFIPDSDLIDSATGVDQPRTWGYWIYNYDDTVANAIITDKTNVFSGDHFWSEQQGEIGDTWRIQGGVDANDHTLRIDKLEEDVWHCIVFTYDGTNERAYRNGTLVDGPAASTPLADDVYQVSIGGNPVGAYDINATIDEFFIMNRSLTSGEVSAWCNRTSKYNANYTISNIPDGTYDWNVQAYDDGGAFDWGDANWSFTVGAVGDSCTCPDPAGDWKVDCSDDCIITEDCVIHDYDLILSGTGTFRIEADIYVDTIKKDKNCAVYNAKGDGNAFYVKKG